MTRPRKPKLLRKLLLLLAFLIASVGILFVVINLFYGLFGGFWTPAAWSGWFVRRVVPV